MPNPNSSGTGFLDVSSWMQIGEKKSMGIHGCLHENLLFILIQVQNRVNKRVSGEFTFGDFLAWRAIKVIKAGAPNLI
ncbi:MAG: hypothetical protein CM1200mP5_1980 [Candidatus Pelagibacterales bacterium]|nr:MAG: hypothetical protein CM1200mP5_1980 [Pelagibacterales bacterium]